MARSIRYAIERKDAEKNLAYLKQYDPLTGLANRTLFQDRLQQALARADRDDEMVALMLLDLDHFKAVNDILGHAGGDQLLKEVAERMKECVRTSDSVARLGADEFAIILEEMSDARDVAPVAQDILDTLSESFVLDGHEVPVTASIGIAVRPPSEADRLLKDADAALRRVKERGRNTYEFYTEEMNIQAFERLTLRNMLRQALKEEEFLLHYQPQVDLATGEIVGAEALLRWRHPDLGLVSPARFVPVLEDTGDIGAVGRWVMQTACRQNKDWQESGVAPLRVAVNLSARQFSRGGLMSTVADVLEESGIDPGYLELEITESLLMEDIDASSQILNELKNMAGGPAGLDRRLRNRLLLALLPQELPYRPAKDRPVLRPGYPGGSRRRGDHHRHNRAGPQSSPGGYRRGCGDRGAGDLLARAGLRRGPGLLF